MRIIETKVYAFDELEEQAKETAREWWREHALFDDWYEHTLEDAVQCAEILGISISPRQVPLMNGKHRMEPQIYFDTDHSSFYVWFAGAYGYAKGASRRIREYAPQDEELARIADTLQKIQRRHFYSITASVATYGRDSMEVLTDIDDGGIVRECIHDFADWIACQLQREYEWLLSDEQVDEGIRANEYEFDEHGNRA